MAPVTFREKAQVSTVAYMVLLIWPHLLSDLMCSTLPLNSPSSTHSASTLLAPLMSLLHARHGPTSGPLHLLFP